MTDLAALRLLQTAVTIQRRALTSSQGHLHLRLLLPAAVTVAGAVIVHQVAAVAEIVAAVIDQLPAAAAVAHHLHLLPVALLLKALPVQKEGTVVSKI